MKQKITVDKIEFQKLNDGEKTEHILPKLANLQQFEYGLPTPDDSYTPVITKPTPSDIDNLEKNENKKKRFLFGWVSSSAQIEICPVNIPNILIKGFIIYFILYSITLVA